MNTPGKILAACFCFFMVASQAQKSYTDSLLHIISNSKDIQTRVEAARHYTWYYAFKDLDSISSCGNTLIRIGKEKSYKELEAMGISFKAYANNTSGKTYEALTMNIQALKMAEKVGNDFLLAFIYNGYGNIYGSIDPEKALRYYRKTFDHLEGNESMAAILLKTSALVNTGSRFNQQKKYDSAFFYLKKAEEFSVRMREVTISSGGLYRSLGNTYLGLNETRLAFACYQKALDMAVRLNEYRNLRNAYVAMSRYYKYVGQTDSALHYLQLGFHNLDISGFSGSALVEPTIMGYEIYKSIGDEKQALKFLEMNRYARMKSDSVAQLQQVQALTFEEDQRQIALNEEKEKQALERKHNLQYAGIALGLITLVVLFFLFSHSAIAKEGMIKFLGILALLIVFEFLNLFLHPFIGSLTNHSPLLMLGIMVAIAALLIPLHHKLEHWITHKLVEKNKRIRLVAAKKTIAELERKVPNHN